MTLRHWCYEIISKGLLNRDHWMWTLTSYSRSSERDYLCQHTPPTFSLMPSLSVLEVYYFGLRLFSSVLTLVLNSSTTLQKLIKHPPPVLQTSMSKCIIFSSASTPLDLAISAYHSPLPPNLGVNFPSPTSCAPVSTWWFPPGMSPSLTLLSVSSFPPHCPYPTFYSGLGCCSKSKLALLLQPLPCPIGERLNTCWQAPRKQGGREGRMRDDRRKTISEKFQEFEDKIKRLLVGLFFPHVCVAWGSDCRSRWPGTSRDQSTNCGGCSHGRTGIWEVSSPVWPNLSWKPCSWDCN